MPALSLHHVSIPVRNLERAIGFYSGLLKLPELERPGRPESGRWYGTADRQVHLIVNPSGTYRTVARIDYRDVHLALRTDDLDATRLELQAAGYDPALPEDHPFHMLFIDGTIAGFRQIFLLDPDGHTVEINDAPGP